MQDESLFGPLPPPSRSARPAAPVAAPAPAQVQCLECMHYAGARHDRGGFLLRVDAGYCLKRIERGWWGVLYGITKPRECSEYSPAPEELCDRRWAFVLQLRAAEMSDMSAKIRNPRKAKEAR